MYRESDPAALGGKPASPPISVLADLAEDDRLALQALGRFVCLQRGEALYLAGEPEPPALFIQHGLVRAMIDLADGGGALAALMGAGEAPGLGAALAGDPAGHAVIAVAETRGLAVSGARLRQLVAGRPRLLDLVFRLLAAQALALETEIACAATHRIEQRIARLLMAMRDQLGRERFELRQEELAQMVSVQRTTVSMLAHGLKAKGLLAYRRGVLQVANPAGLAAVSCGCGAGPRL
jgi:CRP-like cAMP-binding protein